MENKRENLVPSANLAEFYKEKIATSLKIIYVSWLDINTNHSVLKIINSELHQIYKQIRNRLEKFEFGEKISEYEKIDSDIKKLNPFRKTRERNNETGDIEMRTKRTNEYVLCLQSIEKKESIIYDCLDCLGLFGAVEYGKRRLT